MIEEKVVLLHNKLYICSINIKAMSQERIDLLESKVESLESVMKSIHNVLRQIQSDANDNFSVLNSKIDDLHSDTGDGFKEVKLELKKIQNVTGYEAIYANTPNIGGKA
jgi:hypothetical protein